MKTIRLKQVASKCGDVSITTILRWEADPTLGFPQSFFLADKTRVWDEEELDSWITKRKETSRDNGNQVQENA